MEYSYNVLEKLEKRIIIKLYISTIISLMPINRK